jgi:hypothetical protein
MSREAVAMAERKDGARNEERRESPRVPMRFQVRRAGSGAAYESREGDLSLGGFAWSGGAPVEAGAQVEVRFLLPGAAAGAEIEARGEVLQVTQGPQGAASHVRFLALPMEAELAIARYLDDVVSGTQR